MSHSKENVVVICEDNSVAYLIESILSSFETYQVEIRSFKNFGIDHFLSDPCCMVIIDETVNVSDSLALNQMIRRDYENAKIIALSSYPEGDFQKPFMDSGADYVLSFTDLHKRLPEICRLELLHK